MKSKLFPALLCVSLLCGAVRIAASEGRVAVFRDGEPIRETSTPLRVLPESDRRALGGGIWAASDAGAAAILEDFCG